MQRSTPTTSGPPSSSEPSHSHAHAHAHPPLTIDPSACKFCKRPSTCPSCSHPLSPPKKGPTNIDGDVPDPWGQLPPPMHDLGSDSHPEFRHCLPPNPPTLGKFSVFAAGSIEMGAAIQWQPLLANYLCPLPITLLNPRRGTWDQSITPSAKTAAFRTQVEWELDALTRATVIAFFFDHATMSPVTMCELGLWAHSGKVVVCCDRRFWKSGNVELVCERYGVPIVGGFGELVGVTKAMLRVKGLEVEGEEWLGGGEEEARKEVERWVPKRWGMEPDLGEMIKE